MNRSPYIVHLYAPMHTLPRGATFEILDGRLSGRACLALRVTPTRTRATVTLASGASIPYAAMVAFGVDSDATVDFIATNGPDDTTHPLTFMVDL